MGISRLQRTKIENGKAEILDVIGSDAVPADVTFGHIVMAERVCRALGVEVDLIQSYMDIRSKEAV